MWLEAIGKGMAVGFGLAFAVGPVFFALLDTAITRGFREGLKFAVGISASDIGYAALFWLGVGSLLSKAEHSAWLALGGGVVLIILGLSGMLRKPSMKRREKPIPDRSAKRGLRDRFGSIGKGFLLNTLNPGTSVVWLGAGTAGADLTARGGLWVQGAFMAAILITVLSTDILKAYGARRLKDVLTTRKLIYVNRIAGAVMAGAGLLLIGSVWGRLGK